MKVINDRDQNYERLPFLYQKVAQKRSNKPLEESIFVSVLKETEVFLHIEL